MTTMNDTTAKIKPESIFEDLQTLLEKIDADVQENMAAHRVEKQIFHGILELGLKLLAYYFHKFGVDDQGETIKLDDERIVKRLPHLGQKNYQSIFGEITLERSIYGSRVGQKINYVPLDARLQLPERKTSYLLQQWQQQLAGQMTYDQTQKTIDMILGQKPSTHILQRETKTLGSSLVDFQEAKPTAPVAQKKEITVSTVDGKGVPMRDGDKKMALVGCSYTIEPHLRTPETILQALFEGKKPSTSSDQTARPKPQEKRVYTSLLRDENNTMKPSMDAMYDWLEQEYKERNPEHKQPHVALIDGQVSLADEMQRRFSSHENYVEILDVLHAAGYIWDAAKIVYKEQKLQHFCAHYCMDKILNGDVDNVVILLEAIEEQHNLKGRDLEKMHSVKVYLRNNSYRMNYDQYLAAGYPIASGVIEGACRHVVKDRMERSGMRWSMDGAEALLDLRCVSINDEWKGYMDFHIKQENQRLYPKKAANDVGKNGVLSIAA